MSVQGGYSRVSDYVYDFMNRLAGVDDHEQDEFDEYFAYDAQGRITVQRRGANARNNWGGEYSYYAKTNKLEKVANGMGGESANNRNMSASGNFVYDSEGNLIEDKSKDLKISYDWRGMPVEFRMETRAGNVLENTRGCCRGDSLMLTMAYDGSGRRISKTRLRRDLGASDWAVENVTHYTGIGTEVRETHVNGQDETKVVVNLPQGLGRYTPEDAVDGLNGVSGSQLAGYRPPAKFEWYLKNHIGSTMLVYGTSAYNDPYASGYKGGMLAAYDYRAFGERVDYTVPTDKITETFTGKELDDETQLSNHGARMLDPMLGMWISVDPKRFFPSPYLYMGNGYNPIRFNDLNGEKPGDPFGSSREAAQDFARIYNDDAIRNNVEYSAAIYSYKNGDKTIYSYNIPIKGDIASARFDNRIDLTKGQSFETTVHAHGAYLDEYGVGNDIPSPKDMDLNFNVFSSKNSAFVCGPSGYLVEYGKDISSAKIVPTSGIAADLSSPNANPKGADPFDNPVDDVSR